MSHLCTCQRIDVPPLTEVLGLLVRARSPQVRLRFGILLAASGLQAEVQGEAMLVLRQDLGRLQTVLSELNAYDLQELLAVPQTDQGPQPWEVRPLQVWTERLESAWFAEAAGALRFHSQPVVALETGRVVGYEALVRAQLGERLIGAGPLLQAAQAHDQSRAFDALARTSAIRQIYPRLEDGERLFINFAPGVIYNPEVCLQTTFGACREVGADFSRLVFEVTEGEAFPDLRLLKSILDRYRQEGARVALDDLGTGFTSLRYLEELRPDIVKLDRALIRDLHESAPAQRLVQAMTRYAHDLGIQVVAEGIEQAEELRTVRDLGVDFGQGYLLGRPAEVLSRTVPAAALPVIVPSAS